ncbi:hypothetical protein [Undibacterium pigrum]|uniref:Uncharacterized protein n=1 Tax=Undibacterium pigrum TaxID=401470 RepID=A0A318J7M1_9BURK|nr:hypothetical protein [Undibacterium pigrum]PXX42670.1 hypothetical protein DFR42_105332 [Undibacterium pigrum]
MSPFKFSVSNIGTSELVVWIEPWAHDFTLEPGENLVLISSSQESMVDLHRENDSIQIYLNSSSDFIVHQAGDTIHCGHKRRPVCA